MRGPSKTAEAVAALLLPPACREEVLGDLHERYRSPVRYWIDVLTTVPMVAISRIRRTSDPQVLFSEACVLYVSFVGPAWWQARAVGQDLGVARPAIPTAAALIGIALEAAYAVPGRSSLRALSRGPLIGAVLALLTLGAIPTWVAVWGCAMAFVVSCVVKMLFILPGALPGIQADRKKMWTLMNVTIIAFAMVCALLVGVGIGVFFAPTHPDLAHVFFNSIPFLLLCTAWGVAMIFKLRIAPKK